MTVDSTLIIALLFVLLDLGQRTVRILRVVLRLLVLLVLSNRHLVGQRVQLILRSISNRVHQL